MTGMPDDVPAYRTIRIGLPRDEMEARADAEAARAAVAFPGRLIAGPQFGAAREREQGGWEILCLEDITPQQARDELLAPRLRKLAEETSDADIRKECMDGAALLDREVVNELAIAGGRYRIIRADKYIRTGPDGPEPPRPSDSGPARNKTPEDPVRGFIVDPAAFTTLAAGTFTVDLLDSVYPAAAVPPDVHRDSEKARHTHPGGVLLPAAFMAAELVGGHWAPAQGRPSVSPDAARTALARYLRIWLPYEQYLDEDQQAPYVAAADRFEDAVASDLDFAGRRFRIVRVERLMRIGPDGPEGPRESDYDPDPPPEVWEQQRREQGIVEPDENAPVLRTEEERADHERLMRLLEADAERDEKRRGKQ
jgi:hypothetical protein